MAVIRVVDRDGVEHDVLAQTGLKVIEKLRGLDSGVAAICGGMCSYGTCHIYVDAKWAQQLPTPVSDERDLLSDLAHREAGSRRPCQIQFTAALDGLRVVLAPEE